MSRQDGGGPGGFETIRRMFADRGNTDPEGAPVPATPLSRKAFPEAFSEVRQKHGRQSDEGGFSVVASPGGGVYISLMADVVLPELDGKDRQIRLGYKEDPSISKKCDRISPRQRMAFVVFSGEY